MVEKAADIEVQSSNIVTYAVEVTVFTSSLKLLYYTLIFSISDLMLQATLSWRLKCGGVKFTSPKRSTTVRYIVGIFLDHFLKDVLSLPNVLIPASIKLCFYIHVPSIPTTYAGLWFCTTLFQASSSLDPCLPSPALAR